MANALTLSGSIRKNSHNGRLASFMGEKLTLAGMEVNNIDLKDYPLALFNADEEEKCKEPESAIQLAEMFTNADIIFIASPEYNGSLSPLLKNTLDWISRQRVKPYHRAVFGVGAASTGKMGGVGGLGHLREILGKMGALVAPISLGVGFSNQAFDESGRLLDNPTNQRADMLVEQLMSISRS
ncbi:MAG: NAD(P)H-dependent oxidoreductase [Devosiaceae bacterium]|nr:NAD(P)H-dependent oxidoreductase [Devosiaceae bacterium]